jgi:hypothetical protein
MHAGPKGRTGGSNVERQGVPTLNDLRAARRGAGGRDPAVVPRPAAAVAGGWAAKQAVALRPQHTPLGPPDPPPRCPHHARRIPRKACVQPAAGQAAASGLPSGQARRRRASARRRQKLTCSLVCGSPVISGST